MYIGKWNCYRKENQLFYIYNEIISSSLINGNKTKTEKYKFKDTFEYQLSSEIQKTK